MWKIAPQPKYRLVDIIKDIQNDFNVTINYQKAFQVKEYTYRMLSKYLTDLWEANPDSITMLEITDDNNFKRLLVYYHAAWDALRRLPEVQLVCSVIYN